MSTLFLIPTPLGDAPVEQWMLPGQAERLRPLTHFVVEAAKTARKHLKQLALAVEASTGEVHLRHHISPNGFYRGRKVVKTKGE